MRWQDSIGKLHALKIMFEYEEMTNNKITNMLFNFFCVSLLLTVLFTLLGYFAYGGINDTLVVLFLTIACDFMLVLNFVPFVRWLIQILLMNQVIAAFPALMGFPTTWLTESIFWVYLFLGIILNIILYDYGDDCYVP